MAIVKNYWKMRFPFWIPICVIVLSLSGCDLVSPQKSFTLAIPEADYSYNYAGNHLKELLENNGYSVTIIPVKTAFEANTMVANGKADLTFIMNHSTFIPANIGPGAGQLRTILPYFPRLFFLFAKEKPVLTESVRERFNGKKIGIEVLEGETHEYLSTLFKTGKIDQVNIVSSEENPDFVHFWGTIYGERATTLIQNGWTEMSINQHWVDYITLNEPALNPFILPAIPGVEGSVNLNTFSTNVLLVGNASLGENAIYNLSQFIVQHKLDLMRHDKMYTYINDQFDAKGLLYPLHNGADQYLRRDEPTFFERYAEVIALFFSVGALLYGAFQGIKNRFDKIRKERIDLYFIEFTEIRSKEKVPTELKIMQLDALLQRSLQQMTDEKLDKNDFDIFSRLVQQEMALMKSETVLHNG